MPLLTTQDCFQTLTPISPQVAQIVTIAIRGPKSLELQLARHHAALGRAETRRGQRERRAAHTRLSCSGYASTCRGQFGTATRRADGSPASYGDMTLKSVPSRCASRTSSTSTISRTCLGKRSLLGTVPMAESAGEPAILHRLDELPLVRAPRGAQPQDGVWRMRGGLWINRHGMALYEEDAGESDSADDDELGSARPAASHPTLFATTGSAYAAGCSGCNVTPSGHAHYTSPAFASRPSPRPPRARPRLRMCPHALSKPPCARRCPRARVRLQA